MILKAKLEEQVYVLNWHLGPRGEVLHRPLRVEELLREEEAVGGALILFPLRLQSLPQGVRQGAQQGTQQGVRPSEETEMKPIVKSSGLLHPVNVWEKWNKDCGIV